MKRFVGERRALSAAVLAFFAFLYLLVAFSAGPPLGRMFGAIAAVYGVAFFGLVAGYFWARWFALGVAIFGVIQGGVAVWQLGADVLPLFLLGTHAAAAGALWGSSIGELFDGRTGWRERWSMDEAAANRLGNAVTRAGVSLPFVLIYALAPKAGAAALAAGALAVAGTWGLARLRGWSVLALLGASVTAGVGAIIAVTSTGAAGPAGHGCHAVATTGLTDATAFGPLGVTAPVWLLAGAGAILTAAALAPLARPIVARLLGRT
ncbi:MAG: hypothetical protein KA297_31030 [Kofleriaceae bacterium]|jgi:hypothetical protein|nr:hypothetical protein [Kofleriaceae bacterium]MBP6841905.1 hypothetical protein [Kofleriaceae bacterium]